MQKVSANSIPGAMQAEIRNGAFILRRREYNSVELGNIFCVNVGIVLWGAGISSNAILCALFGA